MFAFLPDDMDVNLALETHYSASLVLLSYLIASTAAFTALNMADRLSESSGRARQVWLWVGASAMGVGIWAMHFIGMLAFQLPVEVKYNLVITVASVIPGVLASAVAIHQISEGNKRYLKVLKGGLFMGAGIGGMHYIGMAGMEVTAMMYYRFDLFVVSIVVAVLLATIAILPRVWASKYQGTTYERYYHIGSMMIMGLAVAGMHYTAMASVVFFS